MEPLGTITVYFPFLDEKTKDILETTMRKASDYSDFVHSLTQKVLKRDCSELVAYFAIHHAAQLLDLKTIDLIGQKYADISILKPNICFASHFQGKTDNYEDVIQAADAVLATNPDDWLTLEMRFMKFEAETFNYPETIQDSSNVSAITEQIKNDSRLEFYATVLYNNLARIADIDGNSDEWDRCNQIALDNARKHDDQIRLAYCLIEKADISSDDRILARKLLHEALDIMDSLGAIEGYSSVLERLSALEMLRGEFSSAIEHYLEVISIRESLGMETGLAALMLSTLYNNIGECESGLEWGRMAEDQFMNRPFFQPRAVTRQVWALAILNRIPEAELLLDTVHESILKSGRESLLAWLNFATGIIEFAKGDYTAAMSSIEEALKIFEKREGTMMVQNIFLRYLAKIEVVQSDVRTEVLPYLTLLEERAISEELPGILGQVLLLKSDLALIQNDDSSLQEIIQQLTPLAHEPRTAFLMPFLERLLSRV